MTGPVDAKYGGAGDVLMDELLEFVHEGWGYTAIFPGFGLLPGESDDYALHVWPVSDDGWAAANPSSARPDRAVVRRHRRGRSYGGPQRTLPPTRLGGNIQSSPVRGQRRLFPVEVPGALLSVGDGQLAQGDGEVCGIAIEAPLTVTIRPSVLKGRAISSVECQLATDTAQRAGGVGYRVTTAAGQDMQEGARTAVGALIDYLERCVG